MGGKLLQPYIHDGVVVIVNRKGEISRFHLFVKNHKRLPSNKSLRDWANGQWKGDVVAFRKGHRHELINLAPGDVKLVDYAVKR